MNMKNASRNMTLQQHRCAVDSYQTLQTCKRSREMHPFSIAIEHIDILCIQNRYCKFENSFIRSTIEF